VAVTANDQDWLLVNTSPEVLQQIRETPALHGGRSIRDSASPPCC
jgi:pyrroloquinoline quinone biosynthesis protein B